MLKRILSTLLMACTLLLTPAAPADAQTRKRPAPAERPQSATLRAPRKLVETITTPDGRDVHLYDDGTYTVEASAAPPAPATVAIEIKAGVITRGGDVKAVARAQFIIFSRDVKDDLASVTDQEGKRLDVFGFFMADEYRELDNGRAYNAALEKLKPSILSTFTTDFEGKAAVEVPRAEGTYYVYGHFKVGRSACMWYLPFKPDKGGSLVLDNNNAAYCG